MPEETEDLKKMLDEPKSAIRSMSLPLLLGFLIANLQLFLDSFWCSGLGPAAMAAISITGSLYWVVTDVGVGMGVGVSTAIARALGAKNDERANSMTSQALCLTILLSIITSLVIFVIAEPLLRFMGGSEIELDLCYEYLYPYLICSFPLMMSGILTGILRSEGAAKKSAMLSVATSVFNMILDPILIYGLNLGILGASIATCISFTISVIVGLYWYLSGRMYLRPKFKRFRFRMDELKEIFIVGVPHTLELVLVPLMIIPQNYFVVQIGGEQGIVCNFTPFRYVSLAAVPAMALAAAMVPVTSAALGQKDYPKALVGYSYTAKVCIIIGVILSVAVILLAEPLSYVFTYSEGMSELREEFSKVIRIYGFVILFLAVTDVCSSILQTLQYATLAMGTMFFRECLFILFYWISTFISMDAIYWSLLIAEGLGALIMMIFANYSIRKRAPEYTASPS
jgi:putative MATE family efflux protein